MFSAFSERLSLPNRILYYNKNDSHMMYDIDEGKSRAVSGARLMKTLENGFLFSASKEMIDLERIWEDSIIAQFGRYILRASSETHVLFNLFGDSPHALYSVDNFEKPVMEFTLEYQDSRRVALGNNVMVIRDELINLITMDRYDLGKGNGDKLSFFDGHWSIIANEELTWLPECHTIRRETSHHSRIGNYVFHKDVNDEVRRLNLNTIELRRRQRSYDEKTLKTKVTGEKFRSGKGVEREVPEGEGGTELAEDVERSERDGVERSEGDEVERSEGDEVEREVRRERSEGDEEVEREVRRERSEGDEEVEREVRRERFEGDEEMETPEEEARRERSEEDEEREDPEEDEEVSIEDTQVDNLLIAGDYLVAEADSDESVLIFDVTGKQVEEIEHVPSRGIQFLYPTKQEKQRLRERINSFFSFINKELGSVVEGFI